MKNEVSPSQEAQWERSFALKCVVVGRKGFRCAWAQRTERLRPRIDLMVLTVSQSYDFRVVKNSHITKGQT